MSERTMTRDAVSSDDFRQAVTEAPVPVLLAFAAAGDEALSALLDALAHRFEARLRVGTVIARDNPGLCQRLAIVASPVLVLYRHGVETARRAGTPVSVDALAEWLEPLLADICGCDRCR